MILFTNGCSWTWGGGLEPHFNSDEERLQIVWPHHLGNLLNAEQVINMGEGCGSNQRIFRTTFDWLTKQSQETLDNTYAVIQWTDPSRYEYYKDFETYKDYDNDPKLWTRAKVGCLVNSEFDYDGASKRNDSRLETWTSIEGIYSEIMYCESLASLFKKFNVRYGYWCYGNQVFNYPEEYKKFMLDNYTWLDGGHCNWDYERISVRDPHPSVVGHQLIAEIIYNKIKDNI